jgi:ABC-type branched-subunit amino acid transport system permease subunit/ABC-type branched-subunit amino acid transport system substrate-binding protein
MGLNLLTGSTGQISLGNAAFLAVGGYATAALAGRFELPFFAVIPLAGIIAALVGMLFGIPSLRLRGLYLAMATLAAHFIVAFVATHWDSVTGGVNGISVPAPKLGPVELDDDRRLFYLIYPLVILLLLFARNLARTRTGRAFVAVRDQELAAEVSGIDVYRYKLLAFALSSFYAGVAGALLAYQARLISPENYPISLAIDYLAMIIVGGLGSVLGSILGATFITLLPEVLRLGSSALTVRFPGLVELFASLKMGVFGLVIILFLVFEPHGMAARIRSLQKHLPFLRRNPMKQTILAVLCLALAGGVNAQAKGEIKVGGIFDLTGITSDVGKSFAQGVRDGVAWTNANGGVNGKTIKLVEVDYGYKIPEAVAAYKRMVGDDKVVMINGWGTGDTEGLKEFVNKDKVPYLSASFSGHLTNPTKTPYNFFVAPTYSDQLRSWLRWVKDDWKDKSRNPKVAFMYGDNAYGKSPMEAGRQYCKEIGVELVAEAILPGAFQDATSQLLDLKQKGAEYAYINVTTTGVSTVLKDAKKLGLAIKFGSNPYGFSESLPAVAKEAAEGVTGVMPDVPFGENVPGMARLTAFHQKNHPDDTHDALYVRGWTYVLVWSEALKRADSKGALTGEAVKAALETMTDFDLGGLTNKVTYSATDHRPMTKTPIYMVKGGKLVKVAEYDMPRKPEWLGL